MAMTIKNARVLAKIRGLAGALETDQVSAVEQAVDALSEQVSQSTVERRLADAMELVHAIQQSLPAGVTLDAEDLYDEAGLPR
ncbi:MAG: type II toxin-antitoxin system VapB family antitoxin [Actinobacteria bacterium]|nr:type II toxin-antitoxin system VapB family antitoxin [Actinomycetota bacterium]MCO5300739.1 type II toxin-antitoxin system VapB family antitoxin [Candidatus Nanopelagicales bacterium]MCB9429435.1 type II toxin-antitoxin system VapB family antitoxin [Actinomycetota bacterium]HPE12734.1 type II toxin-antitoxin system VapB family antitoxin [Actinomycetota bacterium]HPJ18993.1 type II toxin-antitoxin system VapB family antitoxin [Actinomycetota bacterium]